MFLHWLGLTDAAGRPYLFWSGAGSDLAYLGIIVSLLRRYNCHARRCWRIGRHPVEGTGYVTCRKHHPEGKPTEADIREKWHLFLGKQPGRG